MPQRPIPEAERPRRPGTASPYGANAPAFKRYTDAINAMNRSSPGSARYTEEGYTAYANRTGGLPTAGATSGSMGAGGGRRSSGGGGYSRGGGGGGSAGMSQAMFDAALKILGQKPGQLQLQQTALPAFQGQNLAAFDPAVYNQARQQLASAVTADQAAVQNQGAITNKALTDNYQNHYAQAAQQVQPSVEQVQGAGLLAQQGGNVQPLQQQNQALAGGADANFTNLLNTLSAMSQQSQASRMNQSALDQQTALRNIGTQNTALTGQIGMGQTQAYQQWLQRDEERRNQNALMQQQWARENAQRQQDLENQQRTTNYQTGVDTQNSRLQPLLDLIMQTQGTKVNTAALLQMLGGA